MPCPHYTLTLTGTPQRLSDALGSGYTTPRSSRDVLVTAFVVQPGPANTGPIVFGGSDTLTTTDYGWRVEAANATIPPAPFVLELGGRIVRPSDMFVRGTAGEKLHFQLIGA